MEADRVDAQRHQVEQAWASLGYTEHKTCPWFLPSERRGQGLDEEAPSGGHGDVRVEHFVRRSAESDDIYRVDVVPVGEGPAKQA